MHLSSRQLELVFRKLEVADKPCAHHRRGFILVDGKPTIPVHYSHGKKGLSGGAAHAFRRDLLLSQPELEELIACTLSHASYIELIQARLP